VKRYKAYLIDLDGTMYKGADEVDGAAQFINYLNKKSYTSFICNKQFH